MPDGPVVGDAFGDLLCAALDRYEAGTLRHTSMFEIVERSDGHIDVGPAKFYLSPPSGWLECERLVVDRLDGHVLDIGAGAGRLALVLQGRGQPVTALDPSPGAVAVCRRRGVTDVVAGGLDAVVAQGRRYDCFALFGNNLSLLESAQRAGTILGTIAAIARPGARLIGVNIDPNHRDDEATAAYMARNAAQGRMPGQQRVRERFRRVATPWFDVLWCSPEELDRLTSATPWRLTDVQRGSGPSYAAVLELRG